MESERLVVLTAELSAQLDEIETIYRKIEARNAIGGDAGTESLGYQLHNLYCAVEDLFHLVASAFENNVETGGGYHIALLRRMTVAMPGVRPALVPREAFGALDSLRSFRHAFRHAYGSSLDPRKVELVRLDAESLRSLLRPFVQGFLDSIASD